MAATAGILGLIGPRRSRRRFEESYYSSSDETDSEHSEQESVSDQQVVPAGAYLGLLSQKRPSTEYSKPTSNVNHKGNSKVGLYGSPSQNPSRPISVQRKIDWYLKHGESDVESDDEICVCMGKCASRQCPCRKRTKSCSAMCLCNMRQCQNLDNRYGRATPIELPNWIPNGRVKRHDDVPVVPTTVGRTPWQFSPPQDTREGQGQSSNEVSPVHDEGREDGGPGTAIYSRESDKRGGLGFDGVVGRDLSSEMIQSESKNETKPTLSSEANTADKVTCYCHSKCLTYRCQCNKAGKYCENCSCSDSFCQNRRPVERPDDFYENLDLADLLRPAPSGKTAFDTLMDQEIRTFCRQRREDLGSDYTPDGLVDMAWSSICKAFAKDENGNDRDATTGPSPGNDLN